MNLSANHDMRNVVGSSNVMRTNRRACNRVMPSVYTLLLKRAELALRGKNPRDLCHGERHHTEQRVRRVDLSVQERIGITPRDDGIVSVGVW
jgi:hypothetical protein